MIPTQEELLAQWLPSLKAGAVYQKIGRVNAKRAGESGRIETLIGGAHETSNHCRVGDYIVVGPQRERYSLAAHDFSSRYDIRSEQETGDLELRREGFKSFEPTGVGDTAERGSCGCALSRRAADGAMGRADGCRRRRLHRSALPSRL